MDFTDKVAIVTGGAQGIGKAYTDILLDMGMKVCICDINDKIALNCFDSEAAKKSAIFLKCDVTSFTQFEGVFEKVISKLGRIDMVINNAGICDEENWRKMVDINLIGVINGVKLGLKYMDKSGTGNGGHIISTSSIGGLMGIERSPVYSATKYGVIGLTKSYGTDLYLKTTGITVNAICPGTTETPAFLSRHPSADKESLDKLRSERRPARPHVIAKGLLKLLEDKMNGAALVVDVNGSRYYEEVPKDQITSISF